MAELGAEVWALSPLFIILCVSLCSAGCPCTDPSLCEPIKGTQDFEVLVFYTGGKNWKFYDWSQVTTIALFGKYDPELLCFAHSKGARLVLKAGCPCTDPSLCEPIKGTQDFEVLVFYTGGKNWKFYDWSQVTTIALFGKYDPELLCFAHSKGARLVLKGDVPLQDIVDPNNRTSWIKQKVELAKSQFMDGINLDIEQSVLKGSPEYYALTSLVQETTEAFHREIPGSQVTFDVAWSPDCVDGRCYNYTGIAESCDFLFVMSYDEQSQIWTDCMAGANSPLYKTLSGYKKLIQLEIDPKKLLMGVPWYGYDYPCLELLEDNKCTIQKVPFRGAPCSDAAGRQIPYSKIMKQVNSSLTGRLWDDVQKSPFYNYKDAKGQLHQVWYDDPMSISLKSAYVKINGLRGIGMWNGDQLDYSRNPIAETQTKDMWNALKGAWL